jgi:hypothetical protein
LCTCRRRTSNRIEQGREKQKRWRRRNIKIFNTDDIRMVQPFQDVHLTPDTTLVPLDLLLTYNLQRHVLLHPAVFVSTSLALLILIFPQTENGLGRRSAGESLPDGGRARAAALGLAPRPETQQPRTRAGRLRGAGGTLFGWGVVEEAAVTAGGGGGGGRQWRWVIYPCAVFGYGELGGGDVPCCSL